MTIADFAPITSCEVGVFNKAKTVETFRPMKAKEFYALERVDNEDLSNAQCKERYNVYLKSWRCETDLSGVGHALIQGKAEYIEHKIDRLKGFLTLKLGLKQGINIESIEKDFAKATVEETEKLLAMLLAAKASKAPAIDVK